MAAKLAEHGRSREGDERNAALGVEAVDCVNEAEARDLDQVLGWLTAPPVAERHAAGERHVAAHELLAHLRLAQAVVAREEILVAGEASCRVARSVAHVLSPVIPPEDSDAASTMVEEEGGARHGPGPPLTQ